MPHRFDLILLSTDICTEENTELIADLDAGLEEIEKDLQVTSL